MLAGSRESGRRNSVGLWGQGLMGSWAYGVRPYISHCAEGAGAYRGLMGSGLTFHIVPREQSEM